MIRSTAAATSPICSGRTSAWGARPDMDGLDGVSALDGHLANTPIEELEQTGVVRGRRFLVQRWEVDHLDAPDGIAIIGLDGAGYLQHYFDSRGIARVYEMTFADNVWTLERHAVAPDFSQRFIGNISDDGDTVAGGSVRFFV